MKTFNLLSEHKNKWVKIKTIDDVEAVDFIECEDNARIVSVKGNNGKFTKFNFEPSEVAIYEVVDSKSKYKAHKTYVNGIVFDSRQEAKRYIFLKEKERVGSIKDLTLQPRFVLQPAFKKNGKTIRKIEYVADFRYWDCENKEDVVEDVKGFKTDVYNLKKKLFEYRYLSLNLREIYGN